MIQNPSPNDHTHNPKHNLPPVGKSVRVSHNGLERTAYLDGQGKWRCYVTGDILAGEVTIISVIWNP